MALGLKQKRKDLVKMACISVILNMVGRDEGTEESNIFQSSPKIITVGFNLFGVNQVKSFDISNSDFCESATSGPASQTKDISGVWYPEDLCKCLLGGWHLCRQARGGSVSWESISVDAGVTQERAQAGSCKPQVLVSTSLKSRNRVSGMERFDAR